MSDTPLHIPKMLQQLRNTFESNDGDETWWYLDRLDELIEKVNNSGEIAQVEKIKNDVPSVIAWQGRRYILDHNDRKR